MNKVVVKDGRVVEVVTERLGGGPPLNQLLFVAADDDQEAENIARSYAGGTNDLKVRSLAKLDAGNVAALGMRPGQVIVA